MFKFAKKSNKLAFSLVELSIVLVITGALISGIVSGKSLYESSKLTNIIQQSQNYTTAVNAFKSKYNQWPGDATMSALWNSLC